MVGEGRIWPLPNRYPIATRVLKTKESFRNRRGDTRFGTEGSVVRIHSPRPLKSSAIPRCSV
jgi:hypothetical protein